MPAPEPAGLMILRANMNKRIKRYGSLLSTKSDEELFEEGGPLRLTDEERTAIVTRLDGDVYNVMPRLFALVRLSAALLAGGATYNHPIVG
jgi:hypothetical protein